MIAIERFRAGGHLPFTGRSGELDRLLDFWAAEEETGGLQSTLLIAEAGCGKSRTIDELIPRVVARGGVVVHAKLRPEGIASIGALLAPALWGSESAGRLLKAEPEPTLPSVTSALQRTAGLRRTLLVIEDVHLLEGRAAQEFESLMSALDDEPIRLLCTARPSELAVRAGLAESLRSEIMMGTLDREELALLWRELFGVEADAEIIDLIAEETHGNPLVLRSALRGALNSGALDPERFGGPIVSRDAFADVLARSVDRVASGMIAHLTAEERRAAENLATLGETFSTRAASLMLGAEWERLLDVLKREGIVARAGTASVALNGVEESGELLAFTHSLLHDALAESTTIDPHHLLPLIGTDVPLYSILPYQRIAAASLTVTLPMNEVVDRIDEIIYQALGLDRTSDWRYALPMLEAAWALNDAYDWPDETERLGASLRLQIGRIKLMRQRNTPEVYGPMIERIMEETEDLPEPLLDSRLNALAFHQEHLYQTRDERHLDIWNDVEDLLARHPRIRYTTSYIEFIREAFHFAGSLRIRERVRTIEETLIALLESEDTSDEIKALARLHVGKYLLMSFETEEDVARRDQLLIDLEEIEGDSIRRRPWTVEYLYRTGRPAAILEESAALAAYFKEIRFTQSYCSVLLYELAAKTIMGTDPAEIVAGLTRLMATLPDDPRAAQTMVDIGENLISALLLGDHVAAASTVAERIGIPVDAFDLFDQVLHRHGTGRALTSDMTSTRRPEQPDQEIAFGELLRRLLGDEGSDVSADLLPLIARTIRAVPIEMEDIGELSGLLLLIAHAAGRRDQAPDAMIVSMLREATARRVAFLNDRGLTTLVDPLLRRASFLVHVDGLEEWEEWSRWRGGRESRERRGPAAPSRPEEERLRVTMFGAIQYARLGEEPTRLRGGRNQTLLGSLVATRLLSKPLDRIDFIALATGDEENPDRARRSMNVAVLRLREAIGREAIDTDGEIPRLNVEAVTVDLLEAWESVERGRAALREGNLRTAREELGHALRLWNGAVPFPGLYADLFEELRERFESTIRLAVITLGQRLLEADDPEGVEETVGTAFAILPDDEEIGAIYRTALERLGKRADAQGVTMRVAEEFE